MKTYSDLTENERAVLKTLFARIRKDMNASGNRSMLLLWGFVRDFPFRRLERKNHEHNQPIASRLIYVWKDYLPDITDVQIDTWLKNPNGAIPEPIRVKKPFVKPE